MSVFLFCSEKHTKANLENMSCAVQKQQIKRAPPPEAIFRDAHCLKKSDKIFITTRERNPMFFCNGEQREPLFLAHGPNSNKKGVFSYNYPPPEHIWERKFCLPTQRFRLRKITAVVWVGGVG